VTRDGFILVQDDPFDHPVPVVVVVSRAGTAIRFLYENTVTLQDGHRPFTMTTYVEESPEDMENGDEKGHRPP
jgi:hypothetical protein